MTRRFSHTQLDLIREIATATKWAIEIDMEAGKPFEQAKRDRIKQAEIAWKGLTPDMAQAVRNVCWSIAPIDLSRRTHRAVKDQLRQSIEEARGKPLNWMDRLLFRLTGMVW